MTQQPYSTCITHLILLFAYIIINCVILSHHLPSMCSVSLQTSCGTLEFHRSKRQHTQQQAQNCSESCEWHNLFIFWQNSILVWPPMLILWWIFLRLVRNAWETNLNTLSINCSWLWPHYRIMAYSSVLHLPLDVSQWDFSHGTLDCCIHNLHLFCGYRRCPNGFLSASWASCLWIRNYNKLFWCITVPPTGVSWEVLPSLNKISAGQDQAVRKGERTEGWVV